MPIRRWNAPLLRNNVGKTRLLRILVAALACQVWGCASAKIQPIEKADGGTGDTAGGGDATRADGKTANKDGANPDSYAWVCDPFTNDGCDSDNQKCTALQNSGTLSLGCGDKNGTQGEGESCTRVVTDGTQTGDDCDDGLACFSIKGELACHRICPTSGTAHACPSSTICSLAVSGLTGLAFCQEPCKVLEQEGCQPDWGCYALTIGGVCFTAGSTKAGESCSNANDCEAGSTCVSTGSTSVCSKFCSTETDGTPSCSDGQTCHALPGPPPEPNAGYCE